MKRIHVKDDVPYCVIDIYLDQRIFDQAPERCRSETVLQLLTALPGVEIARAHQTLTIGSADPDRSEEHTSELQSLMRISYAVFCLKKKKRIILPPISNTQHTTTITTTQIQTTT